MLRLPQAFSTSNCDGLWKQDNDLWIASASVPQLLCLHHLKSCSDWNCTTYFPKCFQQFLCISLGLFIREKKNVSEFLKQQMFSVLMKEVLLYCPLLRRFGSGAKPTQAAQWSVEGLRRAGPTRPQWNRYPPGGAQPQSHADHWLGTSMMSRCAVGRRHRFNMSDF